MQRQSDKHSELTEDQARDIRARALRFVLDCYDKKKATGAGGPNDVRKDRDAHTADYQYTK
jgi:hypothetical protein